MYQLWFLVTRQWQKRPLRLLLTILSVMIGVATVLGTSLTHTMVRQAFANLNSTLQGEPYLDVVPSSGERFTADKLPALNEYEHAKGQALLLYRISTLRAGGKKANAIVLGWDLQGDAI